MPKESFSKKIPSRGVRHLTREASFDKPKKLEKNGAEKSGVAEPPEAGFVEEVTPTGPVNAEKRNMIRPEPTPQAINEVNTAIPNLDARPVENGSASNAPSNELTMMFGLEKKTVVGGLTLEESINLFRKTEIHGDKFNNQALTMEMVGEANLAPWYKTTIDGKSLSFSNTFDIGHGRVAIFGYCEDEGKTILRSYYRSNSQGVWRYLPNYSVNENGKINWYDKGHGEESITLPAMCQMALAEISNNVKPLTVENPDLLLVGTCRKIDKRREGTFIFKVQSTPRDLGFTSTEIEKKLKPEEILLLSSEQPDFSKEKVLATWKQNSTLYGEIDMEAIPSKNGNYIYVFCRDEENRVWVGSIEDNSEITSMGVRKKWVKGENLTTPAYEYFTQDGGYGNTSKTNGRYVDMFKNYLSKVPVIQEYCKSRNIPIPTPNPLGQTFRGPISGVPTMKEEEFPGAEAVEEEPLTPEELKELEALEKELGENN